MPPANPEDQTPDPVERSSRPAFERHEVLLITVLLGLILVGNLWTKFFPSDRSHSIEVERSEKNSGLPAVDWLATPSMEGPSAKDLNVATRKDLLAIPGIGPSLARSILDVRERRSGFTRFEELDHVPGIGPTKLEAFRDYLFVEEESVADATGEGGNARGASHAEGTVPAGEMGDKTKTKVNLNTAKEAELVNLPGIGRAYAQRIIIKREAIGRFSDWHQVGDIEGIGQKRLENLRSHATIE